MYECYFLLFVNVFVEYAFSLVGDYWYCDTDWKTGSDTPSNEAKSTIPTILLYFPSSKFEL